MDFNTDLISGSWRLFVFSIINCLLFAAVYSNWYEIPFEASIALEKRSPDDRDRLFQSLQSAHVIGLAVKDLGLQTAYSEDSFFSNEELYGEETPVTLRMADSTGVLDDPLKLRIVDDRYFNISLKGQVYQYQYGQLIVLSGVRFSIMKNNGFTGMPQSIIIQSRDINTLIGGIRKQLAIVPNSNDTTTFLLTLKGTHPRKLYEILKEIVKISTDDIIKKPSGQGVLINLETQISQVKTDLQQLRKRLILKPADFHLKTELQSKVSLYFFLMQKRENINKIQNLPGRVNDQYDIAVVSSQHSFLWLYAIALGAGVLIPLLYIYRKK